MYVAVDIGGTKVRFAIISENLVFEKIYIYKSKKFKSFFEAFQRFLKDAQIEKISILIIAVAGPVINNKCKVSNLPWEIDAGSIKQKFLIKKVFLLNDLEALAYSLLSLDKEKDLFWITNDLPKEKTSLNKEHFLFISPGTGLGISFAKKYNHLYLTFATEAGNTLFSPLKKEDFKFIEFLKKKKKIVSWENVLSGRALSLWYEFFTKKKILPEEVVTLALENEKFAKKCIRKCLQLFGRKAGEMALCTLPTKGIYLSGGLTQGLIKFFRKKSYVNTFLKGYFSVNKKFNYLLNQFPIGIILHSNPVLLGCLSFLRNQL